MTSVFSLRIDIDSRKGLVEGVPRILEILKQNGQKASFYVPMGGESNILEILKNRGGDYGRSLPKHSLLEKIAMVMLPGNFAQDNKRILQRILDEGHELGVHGWKHREWTRSLDKIDLDERFAKMVSKYNELFGKKPVSFAAPGFNTNNEYLRMLEKYGFEVASDLNGKVPFHPTLENKKLNHIQVPITIRKGIAPIVESLGFEDLTDNEIFERVTEKIGNSGLATIYVHAEYECTTKLNLLKRILDHIKENGIPTKTIYQIGKGALYESQ